MVNDEIVITNRLLELHEDKVAFKNGFKDEVEDRLNQKRGFDYCLGGLILKSHIE